MSIKSTFRIVDTLPDVKRLKIIVITNSRHYSLEEIDKTTTYFRNPIIV